jgi:hypothetical protein
MYAAADFSTQTIYLFELNGSLHSGAQASYLIRIIVDQARKAGCSSL